MKFNELGLSSEMLSAIEKHGYVEATPIQEKTIPLSLQRKDVIGQAQTGTGKTAAFGLPILENIDLNNDKIQALIVSPTRELAIQTQSELTKLGVDKGVQVEVVYGGSDIRRQISNLKRKPQILVGTPGRLIDHINRRTAKLDGIKTLVLDEADEMLNMGFLEDIEKIIESTPTDRQTLLFSATMPDSIKRIGVKFMKNPEHVRIEAKELTTDLIDQYLVRTRENEKFNVMTHLLDVQQPELGIVFGRTKRRVEELARGLELRGYRAAGLHGDLTQQTRSRVLQQFKAGELDLLVATDVAARGLDITGVTHVYNYDIPQDAESYVHRIGRTGRAGKHGMSITFVAPNEMDYLRAVEQLTKVRMNSLTPATKAQAIQGRLNHALSEVETNLNLIADANVDNEVSKLMEKYTEEELAKALLASIAHLEQIDAPVEISKEKPLPRKRGRNNSRGRDGRSRNGRYNSDRGNRSRGDRRYGDYRRRDGATTTNRRSKSNNNRKKDFVIREK